MSWTPRSAIVRAADASNSVPISSMTITSGMWFSTGFDHHRVLEERRLDLHAARAPDAWMRDVAVAADLVGGVDNHNALAQLVGE